MSRVIGKLHPVLAMIETKPPFEADGAFLLASNLFAELGSLLAGSRQEAKRSVMVRQYLLRFFVDVLCQQKGSGRWEGQLVQAIADIAIGTTARLPAGVQHPTLQKALLHAMLSSSAAVVFNRCLTTTVNAGDVDSWVMFAQFCEDSWQWQQYIKTTTECHICFCVKTSAELATSTCGHVVCAECSLGMATECPLCRQPSPRWLGIQTIETLAPLVGDGSVGDRSTDHTTVDRLRAVALARYLVRQHAEVLLATLETEMAHHPRAACPLGGTLTGLSSVAVDHSTSEFLAQTHCQGLRQFLLKMVWRKGGSGALDAIIDESRRHRFLPWFTPESDTLLATEILSLPFDPFSAVHTRRNPVLGEEYSAACLKIGTCVLDGSFREEDLKQLHSLHRTWQVVATLFSAVYVKLAGLEPVERSEDENPLLRHAEQYISNSYNRIASATFIRGMCTDFTWLPPQARAARSLFHTHTYPTVAERLPSLRRMQVLAYLVVLAEEKPRSWFGQLLNDPLSQTNMTMPSMPEDVLTMIIKATKRGGSEQYEGINNRRTKGVSIVNYESKWRKQHLVFEVCFVLSTLGCWGSQPKHASKPA